MDIPIEKFKEYVSESIKNSFECEMVINKHVITKDGFNRMLKYVKDNFEMELTMHRESLDVKSNDSDIRLSITGKDNILEYCRRNSVPTSGVTVISKQRSLELPPVMIHDYDIRINVNIEKDVTNEEKSNFVNTLRSKKKFYRYKKRYSFMDKERSIRVDMSVVKSSYVKDAKSLSKSKTLSNVEEYEVEIEVMNGTSVKPSIIVKTVSSVSEKLLKLNANVEVLLSKSAKDTLLLEYVNMIDPEVTMEMLKMNKTKYYLRYQPITLMKRNLLDADVDIVSIKKNYSCTEKADGERFIMFINNSRKVYFIDNRLTIYPTQLEHPTMYSCIIDGEYISKGKLNTKLNMYMSFDAYFINGIDIRPLDLLERLDKIKELLTNWSTSEPTIELKKFYHGSENIMIDTKQCLENIVQLPYHTDGLIFTPIALSPGALYENDNTMQPFGGTWNKVFKWKPPEENTIDVLVKFGEESIVEGIRGTQQRCIYAELYVAYRGSLEMSVNVLDIYKNLNNTKNDVASSVRKRLYDFTYLPIQDNNQLPLTNQTREPIANGVIVEMAYDPTSPYMKWIPLRLRKDKTMIMQQTNSIENAANNYNTVMNVWMSISDPVTRKMLTGEHVLKHDEVKLDNQDLYYARETPRNRSLLRPMLDFHNFWVKKRSLFDLFKNKNYRLLEIGCGQAGDLPKWIDNKFATIVGIDNNLDNLLNSNHGAYKRVLDNLTSLTTRNKMDLKHQSFIFLLLDGGVKWSKDMIDSIESEEFAYLTQIAMGVVDKSKIQNKLLTKSHNALNIPFDVISCQFAIHYFFRNMDSLDAFCHNLNNHMKVGGYFIGTCLDGNLVNRAFIDKKTDVLKGELNNKVLWQIVKKYDGYEVNSTKSENLGKQIDVYVETINKIIPEYLVDFDLLQRKLKDFNIELVNVQEETTIKIHTSQSSGSFETLWNNMITENKKGYKHWAVTNTIDNMTDVIKEYSFMNRWFIFKKN